MPLLFSYGTLQQPDVQLSTFGRLLHGQTDELVGFEQSVLTVKDPEFAKMSGKANHAIVTFNGRSESRVPGVVFEVSEAELLKADAYEPAGYIRVLAVLASGKQAWVYAEAESLRRARGVGTPFDAGGSRLLGSRCEGAAGPVPGRCKMTEQQWKDEVAIAVKDLPWEVSTAGCDQERAMCFVQLMQGTESKEVRLSFERFHTVADRKAEIIRQLKHI